MKKIKHKRKLVLALFSLLPCPILANFPYLPGCDGSGITTCTINTTITPAGSTIYIKNTVSGANNTLIVTQQGKINNATQLNANTALITNGIGTTLTINNQGTIGINAYSSNQRSVRTDGTLALTNSGTIMGRVTNNGTMSITNNANGTIRRTIENWNTITNLTQNSTSLLTYSQAGNKANVNNITIGIGSTLTTSTALSANGTITNSGTLSTTNTRNIISFTGTNITNNANISANIITNSTNANVTNNGTIASLTNQRTITNFTNSGTLTSLTNNTTATISTFSANNGSSKVINNGMIANFNAANGTNNITNSGTINNFSASGGTTNLGNSANVSTLNLSGGTNTINNYTSGTITSASITNGTNSISNYGKITNPLNFQGGNNTLSNYSNIANLSNQNNSTLTLTNDTTGNITKLDNAGAIDTLTNKGVITTLGNTSTITTLTNTGTITALTNSNTITTFNANGGTSNTTNTGTIATFTASGGTNSLTNDPNGTIQNFISNNAGANNTLFNNATLTTLNLMNGTNAITNNAGGTITGANVTGGTNTITNSGNINNTLSFSGGMNTLTNNSTITTLENKGTSNLNLTNNTAGNITTFNNSASMTNLTNEGTITSLTNQNGGNITTLTNNNTITNLTNQTGATITTFNSNSANASNITNNGNVGTLNVKRQTLTYNGTGSVNALSVAQGATLSANSTLNATTSITNNGTINGNNNINFTGTDITNNAGANISASITTNSNNANVTNSGSITSLTNNGTATTLNNTGGTITTFNASGGTSNTTNSGTITTFNATKGTNNITNNIGGNIGTFSANGGTNTLNNNANVGTLNLNNGTNIIHNNTGGTLSNVNITGGTNTLNNEGIIYSFTNKNNDIVNINNSGQFIGGISNESGGVINYNGQWDLAGSTNRKVVWQASVPMNERYNFKNSGVNSTINITPVSVLVNIKQSNTEYNNANPSTNLLNDAANGHIIVAGDNLGGIQFEEGSILVNPKFNEGFSKGKDYELDSIILNNNNGTLQKAGSKVNANTTTASPIIIFAALPNAQQGITLDTLNPWESIYTIEPGNAAGTFRIGVDVSQGIGTTTAQNSINSNIVNALTIDSVFDSAFLDTKLRNESKNSNFLNVNSNPYTINLDKDWSAFILPYLSAKSNKLVNINGTLDGNIYGRSSGLIVGLTHMSEDAGSFGAFFSYEDSNSLYKDATDSNFDMRLGNISYIAGLRYIYPLIDNNGYIWYLKARTKASITDSGISNTRGTADTKMYSYSGNLGLAVDLFVNDPKQSLTQSFGLGYDGGFIKGFSMDYNPDIFYMKQLFNLYYANFSTRYKYSFTPRVETSVEVGGRRYFNNVLTSTAKIDGEKYKGKFQISPYYGYIDTLLILNFTENFRLFIAYHLLGASMGGFTHTGYFNLTYSW